MYSIALFIYIATSLHFTSLLPRAEPTDAITPHLPSPVSHYISLYSATRVLLFPCLLSAKFLIFAEAKLRMGAAVRELTEM